MPVASPAERRSALYGSASPFGRHRSHTHRPIQRPGAASGRTAHPTARASERSESVALQEWVDTKPRRERVSRKVSLHDAETIPRPPYPDRLSTLPQPLSTPHVVSLEAPPCPARCPVGRLHRRRDLASGRCRPARARPTSAGHRHRLGRRLPQPALRHQRAGRLCRRSALPELVRCRVRRRTAEAPRSGP